MIKTPQKEFKVKDLMNGNEGVIIGLAIVGLPLLLYLYIIMPKDRHCNECDAELSPHRQKTFHSQVNGKNKEICKRCYTRIFGR
jgi:hypothetical protein